MVDKWNRDEKGRFKSRNSPDDLPSDAEVDLIEKAEAVAAELMKSKKDKKLKATGAKLALAIKTYKKTNPDENNSGVIAPHFKAALGRALRAGDDVVDVDLGLGEPSTESTVISLDMVKLLKRLSEEFEISKEEILKGMLKVCPGCKKLAEALKR